MGDSQDPQIEREIDRLIQFCDRHTVTFSGGYWYTVRASRVPRSPERPHGLQYAFTLHSPTGERLLGYDNAHGVSEQSGPARRSRQPVAFDHIDELGKPSRNYEFISPMELIEDFFAAVDRIMKARRG